MNAKRFLITFLSPLALALAGEAAAEGACVHVVQTGAREVLRCTDAVSGPQSCAQRSYGDDGEFHTGRHCRDFGYGRTWGLDQPPAKAAHGHGSDLR
jgi:hypothetical protein